MNGAQLPVQWSPRRPAALRAFDLYAFPEPRGAVQPPIVLTPDTVDMTIVRGADVTIFLDVEEAIDLEQWVITGELRLADELVGSWTVAAVSAETITLQLPHELTTLLPPVCAYDVWRCDFPRGPLVQGTIRVEPRVTVCPPAG